MEEIALTQTETWQYISALSQLYTRITELESSPHAMGLTQNVLGGIKHRVRLHPGL